MKRTRSKQVWQRQHFNEHSTLPPELQKCKEWLLKQVKPCEPKKD
jgi:hypothetical protein